MAIPTDNTASILPAAATTPPAAAAPAAAAPAATAAVHPAAAPIITLAAALANAAQLPAVQAIRDAQAQADAAARAQQQTVGGYTAALAPILAKIAPAVQQGYQQAAGETAAIGQGFGNELAQQQQQNAGDVARILSLSGGQVQQPDVTAATGPGLGGAVGWLNGGLPATGLEQAGAAFGAAANQLPAALAGQGLQQVQSLQAKQALADAGYGQKLSDLAAQYPGLFLKSQEQVTKDALSNAANQSLIDSRQAAETGIIPGTNQPTLAARNAGALQNYRATMAQIAAQRVQTTAAYQNGELSVKQYANQLNTLKAQEQNAAKQAGLAVQRFNAQTNAAAKKAGLSIQQFNAQTSRYRATHPTPKVVGDDKTGRFVINGDGTLSALPGRLGKPVPGVTGTKQTASNDRLVVNHIQAMHSGTAAKYQHVPGAKGADANGFVLVPGTGPSTAGTYNDALNYALAAYGNNRAKATAAVNRIYGTPQKIALANATEAKQHGQTATQTITGLLAGTPDVPLNFYMAAIAKVYGIKPSDVQVIASQVKQLSGGA